MTPQLTHRRFLQLASRRGRLVRRKPGAAIDLEVNQRWPPKHGAHRTSVTAFRSCAVSSAGSFHSEPEVDRPNAVRVVVGHGELCPHAHACPTKPMLRQEPAGLMGYTGRQRGDEQLNRAWSRTAAAVLDELVDPQPVTTDVGRVGLAAGRAHSMWGVPFPGPTDVTGAETAASCRRAMPTSSLPPESSGVRHLPKGRRSSRTPSVGPCPWRTARASVGGGQIPRASSEERPS